MPNFLKITDVKKLKEVPENEDQKALSKKKKILAFNCDQCDMVFSKADHFSTDHRNTEGYKNNQQKVCNQCEYTACTKRGITHHVKKNHATKAQWAKIRKNISILRRCNDCFKPRFFLFIFSNEAALKRTPYGVNK